MTTKTVHNTWTHGDEEVGKIIYEGVYANFDEGRSDIAPAFQMRGFILDGLTPEQGGYIQHAPYAPDHMIGKRVRMTIEIVDVDEATEAANQERVKQAVADQRLASKEVAKRYIERARNWPRPVDFSSPDDKPLFEIVVGEDHIVRLRVQGEPVGLVQEIQFSASEKYAGLPSAEVSIIVYDDRTTEVERRLRAIPWMTVRVPLRSRKKEDGSWEALGETPDAIDPTLLKQLMSMEDQLQVTADARTPSASREEAERYRDRVISLASSAVGPMLSNPNFVGFEIEREFLMGAGPDHVLGLRVTVKEKGRTLDPIKVMFDLQTGMATGHGNEPVDFGLLRDIAAAAK